MAWTAASHHVALGDEAVGAGRADRLHRRDRPSATGPAPRGSQHRGVGGGYAASIARASTGRRPRRHVRVPGGDYDGYIESHVRRLEALRRAGVVERIDADHWRSPPTTKPAPPPTTRRRAGE